MEEKELDRITEKINNFLEKQGISMEDREEIALDMFLSYRDHNKENIEEADNEDDFEDDFGEEEDPINESEEEEMEIEEKPKQEEQPKEPKKSHDFYKKPRPKAPPKVNG